MVNTGTDKPTRKSKDLGVLYSKRPHVLLDVKQSKNKLFEVADQTLFGIPVLQSWSALYMIERFLVEHPREIIIELGTAAGALATFFGHHAETWSFDILKPERCNHFDYGFIQANCFDPETKYRIERLIYNKKALLFCDNGNKPREMKWYSRLLDLDDFMMVHDYKRPGGVKPQDIPNTLETYRQDEWDKLETYILCLRKKRKV